MQPYDYTWQFVASFAGDPSTAIIDWRAIHDTRKDIPAIPFRGTLPECWGSIQHYNSQGYGIFAVIAAMDGQGRELANVAHVRAHYIDLDNLSALQNYERAAVSQPPPCLGVQSSPGKFHVYWAIQPYQGNERFTLLQRKLRQVYDGDKTIIDATRVMRVPGTLHLKAEPHLVTCWPLAGHGQWHHVEAMETALAGVNVIDGGVGERHDLGKPEMAAPSLDWIRYALDLLDPNGLDRAEWIAITSAVKQAGWTLTTAEALYDIWAAWCARYTANDVGENHKQWHSIRNTELGWPSLVRRVPGLRAALSFGGVDVSADPVLSNGSAPGGPSPQDTPPSPVQAGVSFPGANPPPLDCSGEFLTHLEQQEWFKGCTFVVSLGQILAPDGRFLNATQFNGAYGGKRFLINSAGKDTTEAWAAALRSTLWTVPKVDHVRFLPHEPHGAIVYDALGRTGVNRYKPAIVQRMDGDATPFLRHMQAIIPDEADLNILLDFLAHNFRYPGHKIPWAPVIQSVEGAGKGLLKALVTHALGKPYVHFPNAKELTNSGSQFNAWMRNKLFILADEIKVDDKRDLIEVLKPMISEVLIEVQGKGVDQELEDNFSNWCFFTNYKNAVPVHKNGRRYAIFFSPLQTEADLMSRGMGEAYFTAMYGWMKNGGAAIVTDWLMNRPIERGAIPMRAPKTSSWNEALKVSRSPIERVIQEAIEDGLAGFRGGWVSLVSAMDRIKKQGAIRGNVPPHAVTEVLESLGYVAVGRAPRAYFSESPDLQRSELYHFAGWADVAGFATMQGWE